MTLFSLFNLIITPSGHTKNYRDRVVIIDQEVEYNKKWRSLASTDEGAIKKLLIYALKSKTARRVIKKAKKKASVSGQTLLDIIEAGDGSLTDTTLIRKFSPSSPEHIVYKTRSKVVLNKDLNFFDGLLDLIHELVHYTYRKPFNPYTTHFSLDEFVKSTIEGTGGEVDAYLTECRVLKELFPRKLTSFSNCSLVMDKNSGNMSKKLGVEQFFRVGKYYSNLSKELGTLKRKLSNKEAFFISSAYGVPYPLAAVYEFQTIMEKSCENDKKRLEIIKNKVSKKNEGLEINYELGQSLSANLKTKRNPAGQFERSFYSRCHAFIQ